MAREVYSTHIEPNLERIEWWLMNGATTLEICENLNVGQNTFSRYLGLGKNGDERYKGLSDVFTRARRPANEAVEAALFKKCTGYQYLEIIKETVYDPQGNIVAVKERTRVVDVPPDTSAQQFWLTNMRPDKWQYKKNAVIEAEKGETGVVLLPNVIDEQ